MSEASLKAGSSISWQERSWLQLVILVVISTVLYSSVLIELVAAWWGDPNFSHGFFVPLFSGMVVWLNRKRLATIPQELAWGGLVVVAVALCALIVGVLGAEFFLSRSSLVLLIAGLVIYLRGWRLFRAAMFPWACLFLMIPIPGLLLNQVTAPMQLLAAKFAHAILVLFGVPVLREGNILFLPAMTLEVAQACSGIRSLVTLVTLAVIYGYFRELSTVRRLILLLAVGPIAIAANGLRIVATGLLVQFWSPDKATGFFHAIESLFMVGLALLMFFLVHRLMRAPNVRPT